MTTEVLHDFTLILLCDSIYPLYFKLKSVTEEQCSLVLSLVPKRPGKTKDRTNPAVEPVFRSFSKWSRSGLLYVPRPDRLHRGRNGPVFALFTQNAQIYGDQL